MKKLTGMKKNFSSLENRKLNNLKSTQGGLMAAGSSRKSPSNAGGQWDQDYYTDNNTAGEWVYAGRHTLEFD